MSMNFGTDLLPTASGAQNLGSSSKKWNIYAAVIEGVRTQYSFEIATSAWGGTGPFTWNLTASGTTANSKVTVDVGNTFSNLSSSLTVTPSANKLTFSTSVKPSGTVSGTVEVLNIK